MARMFSALLATIVVCIGCKKESTKQPNSSATTLPEPVQTSEIPAVIRHLSYSATDEVVFSISIGTVVEVTVLKAPLITSPSMIQPDREAIIDRVQDLNGKTNQPPFRLRFESMRANAPRQNTRYVFLWNSDGRCIRYYEVDGDSYIRDGERYPIKELKF